MGHRKLIIIVLNRPSRIQQKIRAVDESVASNFRQYGLESQYLDVFVADFSQPYWRTDFKLDAIITDRE